MNGKKTRAHTHWIGLEMHNERQRRAKIQSKKKPAQTWKFALFWWCLMVKTTLLVDRRHFVVPRVLYGLFGAPNGQKRVLRAYSIMDGETEIAKEWDIFFFTHHNGTGYQPYNINQKDKLEINRKRTFFSAKYAYEWNLSVCMCEDGEQEVEMANKGGRSKHAHNVQKDTQRSPAS